MPKPMLEEHIGQHCNIEQYRKLGKNGADVEAWNQWRKDNPDEEIHLAGAIFLLTPLEHIDLRGAHLEHASLVSTHLEHADLKGAHLEHATLQQVRKSAAED